MFSSIKFLLKVMDFELGRLLSTWVLHEEGFMLCVCMIHHQRLLDRLVIIAHRRLRSHLLDSVRAHRGKGFRFGYRHS